MSSVANVFINVRSGKLNCNFIGHLANELEACVAMTGCPGEKDVELTVLSKNNEEHYRFEWKTDGTVIGQDSVLKVNIKQTSAFSIYLL